MGKLQNKVRGYSNFGQFRYEDDLGVMTRLTQRPTGMKRQDNRKKNKSAKAARRKNR